MASGFPRSLDSIVASALVIWAGCALLAVAAITTVSSTVYGSTLGAARRAAVTSCGGTTLLIVGLAVGDAKFAELLRFVPPGQLSVAAGPPLVAVGMLLAIAGSVLLTTAACNHGGGSRGTPSSLQSSPHIVRDFAAPLASPLSDSRTASARAAPPTAGMASLGPPALAAWLLAGPSAAILLALGFVLAVAGSLSPWSKFTAYTSSRAGFYVLTSLLWQKYESCFDFSFTGTECETETDWFLLIDADDLGPLLMAIIASAFIIWVGCVLLAIAAITTVGTARGRNCLSAGSRAAVACVGTALLLVGLIVATASLGKNTEFVPPRELSVGAGPPLVAVGTLLAIAGSALLTAAARNRGGGSGGAPPALQSSPHVVRDFAAPAQQLAVIVQSPSHGRKLNPDLCAPPAGP